MLTHCSPQVLAAELDRQRPGRWEERDARGNLTAVWARGPQTPMALFLGGVIGWPAWANAVTRKGASMGKTEALIYTPSTQFLHFT